MQDAAMAIDYDRLANLLAGIEVSQTAPVDATAVAQPLSAHSGVSVVPILAGAYPASSGTS
jgi:hypothetical protein